MTQPAQRVSVDVLAEDGTTLRLQARLARGERGAALIAPPHPLYGGSIDNPVVQRIAEAMRKMALSTLAFNWRGVEGSQGRPTDALDAAVADYAASVTQLASEVSEGPLFATGYSFGAATALLYALSDARVRGVVLVAPPIGMLREEDLKAFEGRLLVVAGDDDEFAPHPALQALLATRPDTQLETIAGADHFFHFGGLQDIDQRIVKHVSTWL